MPPREPVDVESPRSELELLATLPGARLAEQMAVINQHMARAIASITAELDSGWIGPEHSPLGREPHEQAVRRRIAMRAPDAPMEAAIVDGRHLLTIAALADEYFRPLHEAIARATPANDVRGCR